MLKRGEGLVLLGIIGAVGAVALAHWLFNLRSTGVSEERPVATIQREVVFPTSSAGRIAWRDVALVGSRIVLMGVVDKGAGSGSVVEVFASSPKSVEFLAPPVQLEGCSRPGGLRAVGPNVALATCAHGNTAHWFSVSFGAEGTVVEKLGAHAAQASGGLETTGLGDRHVWLTAVGDGGWQLGWAEGARLPEFGPIYETLENPNIAALPDGTVVLVGVGQEGELRATRFNEARQAIGTVEVVEAEAHNRAPVVHFDGQGLLVAWTVAATRREWLVRASHSLMLVVQRFDTNLEPVGAPQRVSSDDMVARYSFARSGTDNVLMWCTVDEHRQGALSLARFRAGRMPGGTAERVLGGTGVLSEATADPEGIVVLATNRYETSWRLLTLEW